MFTQEFEGTVINFKEGFFDDELLMEIQSHSSKNIFTASVCKYSQSVEVGDIVKFHIDRFAATNVSPVKN